MIDTIDTAEFKIASKSGVDPLPAIDTIDTGDRHRLVSWTSAAVTTAPAAAGWHGQAWARHLVRRLAGPDRRSGTTSTSRRPTAC